MTDSPALDLEQLLAKKPAQVTPDPIAISELREKEQRIAFLCEQIKILQRQQIDERRDSELLINKVLALETEVQRHYDRYTSEVDSLKQEVAHLKRALADGEGREETLKKALREVETRRLEDAATTQSTTISPQQLEARLAQQRLSLESMHATHLAAEVQRARAEAQGDTQALRDCLLAEARAQSRSELEAEYGRVQDEGRRVGGLQRRMAVVAWRTLGAMEQVVIGKGARLPDSLGPAPSDPEALGGEAEVEQMEARLEAIMGLLTTGHHDAPVPAQPPQARPPRHGRARVAIWQGGSLASQGIAGVVPRGCPALAIHRQAAAAIRGSSGGPVSVSSPLPAHLRSPGLSLLAPATIPSLAGSGSPQASPSGARAGRVGSTSAVVKAVSALAATMVATRATARLVGLLAQDGETLNELRLLEAPQALVEALTLSCLAYADPAPPLPPRAAALAARQQPTRQDVEDGVALGALGALRLLAQMPEGEKVRSTIIRPFSPIRHHQMTYMR
ncbi:hypothetical protein PAPYR_6818 [Paratrimastix pyriformis]|uniref:Cilia- and flagella-associated protein 157 n=1 Tax=Paratrimastix pyriformis TaxID=342808 RepID=A0ABQ8UEL0_9EUKA|nr:hypothetical protein PAPYR_6818 [Paratrimastix pyriformis]